MSIDIFTLIVQILNFLLLLFILKKFLYKPIIKAIRDRQTYIKNTIEETEKKSKEAEDIRNSYQNELNSIDKYKKEQKEKIETEIIEYKSQMIEEVKVEVQNEREEFLRQLENDKTTMADGIVKNICTSINDFLVDIFVSLSSSSFENAVLMKFLDEVNNFPNEIVNKINEMENESIGFVSSFELNNSQKSVVTDTFQKRGLLCKNINFMKNEEIVLGNKIIIGSLTINSNIRNIVDQFKTKLEQII